MKGRVVCLDEVDGRRAAALVVHGRLEDLLIDPVGDEPLPGAIYRAVADRPMKGQGGMFVKLPGGLSGFLRQVSGIAPGQRIIVQVTGQAEAGKAVPVTVRLLFRSRWAIVTPGAPGLNISRRIRDEDVRAGLQALAEEAMAGAPAPRVAVSAPGGSAPRCGGRRAAWSPGPRVTGRCRTTCCPP